MSVHVSESFGDVLDPLFQQILADRFDDLPDMVPQLYTMPPTNGRENMKWSSISSLGDFTEFDGTVDYEEMSQGYDTVSTPIEFTKGVQVQRKLFDDDQWQIFNQRPRAVADSAHRTRQKHGARIFNMAFSNDTYFYVNSESQPLCSSAHTTTVPGVSTATGFDNAGTAAMTAAAVAAARIDMVQFLGDNGQIITVMPDELFYPPNLYEQAFEIASSPGKPDTANNNANVHQGEYQLREWNYLTDTNNWFLMDSSMRAMMLFWVDRIALEFAMIEDFDTFIAKWRAYMRYSNAWIDWRWIYGHEVS